MAAEKDTGRHSHSSRSRNSDRETDDTFEDVVLLVEGRKIFTSSSLLAQNSSVFADLLKKQLTSRQGYTNGIEIDRHIRVKEDRHVRQYPEYRSFSSRTVQADITEPPVELYVPDLKYRDVRKLISFLVPKDSEDCQLTADIAWRLLPTVEEYKVSRMKRRCGKVLLDNLKTMREENKPGTAPVGETLVHLEAAEKYGFGSLKDLCIEEFVCNREATTNRELVECKRISDKIKVKILDQRYSRLKLMHEKRLEMLRCDFDRRTAEDKARQEEYQSTLVVSWKAELEAKVKAASDEVQEKMVQIKKDHTKAIEELEEKIVTLKEDLVYDVEKMKDYVIELIEKITEEQKKVANVQIKKEKKEVDTDELIEKITGEQKKVANVQIKKEKKEVDTDEISDKFGEIVQPGLDKINKSLRETLSSLGQISDSLYFGDGWNMVSALRENCSLEESLRKTMEELAMKNTALSTMEIQKDKAEMEKERLQIEIRKFKMEKNSLNTWIKWAKPEGSKEEEKCLCVKH